MERFLDVLVQPFPKLDCPPYLVPVRTIARVDDRRTPGKTHPHPPRPAPAHPGRHEFPLRFRPGPEVVKNERIRSALGILAQSLGAAV